MKKLLTNTLDLFRRNLILWVPCQIAGIILFLLRRLQRAGIHWLLEYFSMQHSVLGGNVLSPDLTQAQHRTMLIVYPLGTVKDFLEICLFVAALAATKSLVQMILEGQRPDISSALREVVPRWREVLLFSFKYMAILALSVGLLIFVSTSPLTPERLRMHAMWKEFALIFTLVAEACLAWLLMPAAIRLLRQPGDPPIGVHERTWGVFLAVATSAASSVLDNLLGKAETSVFLDSPWQAQALGLVNTIIVNSTQVYLFIALALIAIQHSAFDPSLALDTQSSSWSRLSSWIGRTRKWNGGPF